MLSSLFGDLGLGKRRSGGPDWEDTRSDDEAPSGFAATAILESMDTSVNDRGQMVDRHIQDLLITGSPAQGMRRHFASRSTEDGSSHAITLFDPMKVWAPAMIKALSDASGQPVERLHLRQQTTLNTLAMIERTRVVRRFDDTLKIYHADVRVQEPGTAEIPYVLMERAPAGRGDRRADACGCGRGRAAAPAEGGARADLAVPDAVVHAAAVGRVDRPPHRRLRLAVGAAPVGAARLAGQHLRRLECAAERVEPRQVATQLEPAARAGHPPSTPSASPT